MSSTPTDPVAEAYDALAGHYDLLTARYRHDLWLERIEALAIECGLPGTRVLDVACGTGKSALPLHERGYTITGCDLSAAMLERARARLPVPVELFQADMRDLPPIGEFDLVTCLDDAVNYLLGDDDLARALASMGALLAPGGLLIFDVHTRRAFRTLYAETRAHEDDEAFVCWRGDGEACDGFPARASATIELFARDGDGWRRTRSVHRQRHWAVEDVGAALARAGLRCVAVRGQRTGAIVEAGLDEEVHTKAVYVATR